ncbi:MAG: amidohydrolase family protein [Myxococcota bacterium]
MTHKTLHALAACTLAAGLVSAPAQASIEVNGQPLQVVDMHLHSGQFGTMNPEGKAFILGAVPPFLLGHAPALLSAGLDPYEEHAGIQAETRFAGADHAVVLAVYTARTTGYYTNHELLEVLEDPRNDGWAWGLASINLTDVEDDPELLDSRLDAMRSFLTERPDLFIGIKLAHTHQAVTLDDEASFRIYELAGEVGVPVLLHTGFSPFPNTIGEPEYYDPGYLTDIVTLFDGNNGPRVDFVFSHVGQGDARAVEAAMTLAESSDNVWLEISALRGPLRIDENGEETDSKEPQYPYVLEQILARDLVDRTIFASDGAQLSGFVKSYLGDIVDGMIDAGYSTEDMARVLAGSFFEAYTRADPGA